LVIHATKPPATKNDEIPAIMGRIYVISMLYSACKIL